MTICDQWPVDIARLPALPDPQVDQAAYDAAKLAQDMAVLEAVDIIWALSGRQFGVCENKVRPCVSGDMFNRVNQIWSSPNGFGSSSFMVWDGLGWGTTCCGCVTTNCRLSGPSMTHLPGPVVVDDTTHFITVTIAGDVIPPEEWAIEGDVLYRRGKPWPYQDLNRPDGDPCTWSVTYWKGIRPPKYAGMFVAILASEIIAAATGGNCRLPASVRRLSRQGVAMDIDPTAVVNAGYTGLLEVDRWLASFNPRHLMQAPSVI